MNHKKIPGILVLLSIFLIFEFPICSENRFSPLPPENLERVENSGLYAVWYEEQTELLNLPGIVGGQIYVQWKDIEKTKNIYDFSKITVALNMLKSKGKIATLQINGNKKPDYLFDEVPWVEEKLHHQVKDNKGTLMFWHSAHEDAFKNLLKALGSYLKEQNPELLGIRLNFNPFGTEISHIPPELAHYRKAINWNYPPGVDSGVDWTLEVADIYKKNIVDAYINDIGQHVRIFLRNDLKIDEFPEIADYLMTGKLALFHTSSESEPRSTYIEKQFVNFYNYCRSGITEAYAEPWASAWGHHGGLTDDRSESPIQFFYWRLLSDLNCGVSFIAFNASELNFVKTGIYSYRDVVYHNDAIEGIKYRSEFIKAMTFASKYAGYHAAPTISPGAWIAFRENKVVRNANGLPIEKLQLSSITNDYSFLISRISDASIPVELVGSPEKPYGSWARKLPMGEKMTLIPNERFLKSMKFASLRIVWMKPENAKGMLKINTGIENYKTSLKASGKWIEDTVVLKNIDFRNIELEAIDSDIILHMVEIIRENVSNYSSIVRSQNNEQPLIYGFGHEIIIEGLKKGQTIEVFTLRGEKIINMMHENYKTIIPIMKYKTVIVKAGNKTSKISLF